jgi:hypothetical protein
MTVGFRLLGHVAADGRALDLGPARQRAKHLHDALTLSREIGDLVTEAEVQPALDRI